LTFLAVVVGWVLFRAKDLPTALSILEAMSGANGFLSGPIRTGRIRDQVYLTVALLAIALLAPNTQQILRRFEPALGAIRPYAGRLTWRPSPVWLAAIGALAVWALLMVPQGERPSEFLYFQF
jgi:hypothetical protein